MLAARTILSDSGHIGWVLAAAAASGSTASGAAVAECVKFMLSLISCVLIQNYRTREEEWLYSKLLVISETVPTQRGQRQPCLVCTNLLRDQSGPERTILSLIIRELI